MFFPDNDVKQWKEDLKRHDAQRKNFDQEVNKTNFAKPVTWKDIKQKEAEYHPILQKFSRDEKENDTRVKETDTWKHKAEVQRKNIEKYLPEYDIINLEKDHTVPGKGENQTSKPRLQPACQVDYNIITNNQLDEFYFKNVKLNVDNKKKDIKKTTYGNARDFNIISNRYTNDHESKSEVDTAKVENELNTKYNKTHDYNCLLAEYYDKGKEKEYQDKRTKNQHDHGKDAIEKLPPAIRNRETIIFDPTREVPEAIKVLDQKKKDAMKKYELRYKVEEQVKERDIQQQDRAEEMKLKRINDKKFTEHLDKGFDILTMDDYDKTKLPYAAKPVPTKWEKLRLTSNNSVQVQQPARVANEKFSLTSNDLKQTKASEPSSALTQSPFGKGSAMVGWMRSGSDGARKTDDMDFNKLKEFKTAYQRAQEPVYNLADKYNQYCVPPKRVVDDFNTRTLPQIKVADNSLKFSVTKTGGFKKTESFQ